jgi:hypothetical protein
MEDSMNYIKPYSKESQLLVERGWARWDEGVWRNEHGQMIVEYERKGGAYAGNRRDPREEKGMYQNVNTGETWKLDHVEEITNNQKPLKVYVFENGERWAEDLFFRCFRKVGEA